MVGMTGFEPAASASRTRRATKLRYIPICPMTNATSLHGFSYASYLK